MFLVRSELDERTPMHPPSVDEREHKRQRSNRPLAPLALVTPTTGPILIGHGHLRCKCPRKWDIRIDMVVTCPLLPFLPLNGRLLPLITICRPRNVREALQLTHSLVQDSPNASGSLLVKAMQHDIGNRVVT
jgi:hypothetical protein